MLPWGCSSPWPLTWEWMGSHDMDHKRYDCVAVVCPRRFPLPVCSRGNQRPGRRHQVNPRLSCPSAQLWVLIQLILSACVSVSLSDSSSLSQWVHACDALELPTQQREQLDSFIDQLYKDIEKGHCFISVLQCKWGCKSFLSQLSRCDDVTLYVWVCLLVCVLVLN